MVYTRSHIVNRVLTVEIRGGNSKPFLNSINMKESSMKLDMGMLFRIQEVV